MNIGQITKKFYRSEEERIRKLEENKEHVEELQNAIGEDIEEMYENKMRFMVVNIDADTLRINALIVPCCGSQEVISDKIRSQIVKKIIDRTKFKEVIWEK